MNNIQFYEVITLKKNGKIKEVMPCYTLRQAQTEFEKISRGIIKIPAQYNKIGRRIDFPIIIASKQPE